MLKTHHLFALTALASACLAASAQTLFAPTVGEYNWSTSVSQLGIKNVHASGILGQGILVGVLDTGLNRSNPEFASNARVLTGYNAVTGSTDVTDSIGHGTHVAGIIAAPGNGTGMYGVAPGASLLMVKVFNGSTAPSSAIDRGLDYAIGRGARVVNMSLGATGPTGDAALRRAAATNNAVIVVAAGNDASASPNWPARYAKESWANGTIIAVGAVDASKKIASFSNRAGDLAQVYLVAPGVNIISSYGTGYAYMSGTSMATPAVSGAAALVTGYWPYLRANQVAAILLNTADDLGAPGVDAVYGHGMLNVNKALSPIGSFTYKTATGVTATVPLATRGVASSQPRVTTPSAFGAVKTDVFDEYGRNFTSDEGNALSAHSTMTADSILGRTDRMLDTAEQVMADGSRLMRLQSRQSSVQSLSASANGAQLDPFNRNRDAKASLVSVQLASGEGFSAGDGGLSGLTMGLMNSPLASSLTGADTVLANPLLGFAPNHQFATLTMPLGSGWSALMASVQSKAHGAAAGDVHVLELSHQGKHHAFNVSAGQLSEEGLLGGYSSPIMGLDQHTGTTGVTLSGAWALNGQWTLAGAYSRTTTAAPVASGLLVAASGIQSDAYGLGLIRKDTWLAGDRLSFTLNAPLRARSGTLTYSVVEGVDEQGEPLYGTRVVDLRPAAREWLAETRYATRLRNGGTLMGAVSYRQNPDNDASAPSQVVIGLRYNLNF